MYCGDSVVAFDPAEAELEDANEVAAPVPVALAEAFDCRKIDCKLVRTCLKRRQRLENYVILVELRVHRADLALPEGVVKGIIDRGGRDTETRGSDAINGQRHGESADLLIGRHVLQLLHAFHLRDELIGPVIQFVHVRIFQRVLVLGAADAVIDRDVLHRLHVHLEAGNTVAQFSAAGDE